MPAKTLQKTPTPDATTERIAAFLPPHVAQKVRIEAAVERETLSDVISRRLMDSFNRKPAPAVTNA